jgi:hypothetical protein
MPYDKNRKRDYKKEYQQDLKTGKSGPDSAQTERQKARRTYDQLGVNRKDKHIDHKTPVRDGGKSIKGNLRLRDPKANMSDNGK